MLLVMLVIYLSWVAVGLVLLTIASFADPTRRALAELWTVGLLLVAIWPVAIAWALVAAVVRACTALSYRLQRR